MYMYIKHGESYFYMQFPEILTKASLNAKTDLTLVFLSYWFNIMTFKNTATFEHFLKSNKTKQQIQYKHKNLSNK